MKRDLRELDKLEEYLKKHKIKFSRKDTEDNFHVREGFGDGRVLTFDTHQIIVYDSHDARLWDAICQRGSYGGNQGLLEIMGNIVDVKKDGNTVVGFLTAADVIERIERKKNETD